MNHPKPTWVLGNTYDHIASAVARQEKKAFDVEDLAVGFVKFENGASLAIEASWAGNIKENELVETRLLGTKGGRVQRNLDEGGRFDFELFLDRNGCQYDLKPHNLSGVGSSMGHFVDCIIENRPHIATGEEGLLVMQLLDAIYKSAAKGAPVKVR